MFEIPDTSQFRLSFTLFGHWQKMQICSKWQIGKLGCKSPTQHGKFHFISELYLKFIVARARFKIKKVNKTKIQEKKKTPWPAASRSG